MKESILNILRRGERISGKELGMVLGISRSMIWKYISALRREGYIVESIPGSGYQLIRAPDFLLPEEIKAGLATSVFGRQIKYFQEVSSTQDIAKALAAKGAEEGTVVIAETQSEGRGRMGRSWVSQPGGIYFSLILRPKIKPAEAICFLLIAAVAVAQAIEKLTGLNPKLKWPNDIIVEGRKAGGILAEMSAETDRIDYMVVGIGLNVNAVSFPAEIAQLATSLRLTSAKEMSRRKLLQEVLLQLEQLYHLFLLSGFAGLRERWKELSNTIGARVKIISGGQQLEGVAIDLDHDGALILQQNNGSLTRVIAGDVKLDQYNR